METTVHVVFFGALLFLSTAKAARETSRFIPQTYYTIDRLYHRYAAPGRQREREVISAVKLLN
jgi:hypothetical protein